MKISYDGLIKVISGGQTGADMAGLVAARSAGIETGGTAPANFMTEAGPNPGLAEYGLVAEGDLKSRTRKNILGSDATLVLAMNMKSPGTVLTINTCIREQKPYHLIDMAPIKQLWAQNQTTDALRLVQTEAQEAAKFIVEHQVRTLNVAGNRQSKGGMVYETALSVLNATFQNLNLRGLVIRA